MLEMLKAQTDIELVVEILDNIAGTPLNKWSVVCAAKELAGRIAANHKPKERQSVHDAAGRSTGAL